MWSAGILITYIRFPAFASPSNFWMDPLIETVRINWCTPFMGSHPSGAALSRPLITTQVLPGRITSLCSNQTFWVFSPCIMTASKFSRGRPVGHWLTLSGLGCAVWAYTGVEIAVKLNTNANKTPTTATNRLDIFWVLNIATILSSSRSKRCGRTPALHSSPIASRTQGACNMPFLCVSNEVYRQRQKLLTGCSPGPAKHWPTDKWR